MSVKEIEKKFIHTCDNCDESVEMASTSRPKHWTNLKIIRDAYDFHDNACADASIMRLFCGKCSDSVAKLINAWSDGNVPEETELNIVFDGPPSHESGRFVEVETLDGKGLNAGEWHERKDDLWDLRIKGRFVFPTVDQNTDLNSYHPCTVCGERVQDGILMDGCRDPGCPCK